MMQEKQIFIADTNHSTILLSALEKVIISTKLFNRLHYISQNSTAYLTFPSNKTKRFEHSVGTMKLCGDIFHSAVCNTGEKELDLFFKELHKSVIGEVVQKVVLQDEGVAYKFYFDEDVFSNDGEKLKAINELNIKNVFYNKYVPNNVKSNYRVLYLIAFQAVRLCGLLHDIGHPPFSHISEFAMEAIYTSLNEKETLNSLETDYKKTIGKYVDGDKFQLHERIGNEMVKKIFDNLIVSSPVKGFDEKYFILLVIEVSRLIFSEEGIFKFLHSIVSGSIDGDRLDYVNRDMNNSGVTNGEVECYRLISHCKISPVKISDDFDDSFVVTYDAKTINTIDDFFLKRWYLYKNLLRHHRVVKTDFLLQNCLEFMMKEYLDDCNNGERRDVKSKVLPYDISGLWKATKSVYSGKEYFDSVIQWDDSWLIIILKRYYFSKGEESAIYYKLDELLSNEKHYYSLIKSNYDFLQFSFSLIKNLDFSFKENDVVYQEVDNKLSKNLKNRDMHVVLSYLKVRRKRLNWSKYLQGFVRENYKDKIQDSFIIINKIKNGLSQEPIVHRNGGTCVLSKLSNIRTLLTIEEANYPYFYVYVKVNEEIKIDKEYRKVFLSKFGEFVAGEINLILNEEEN